ncbi:hypothetical protein [Amycolatopsis sp. NPDC004625]
MTGDTMVLPRWEHVVVGDLVRYEDSFELGHVRGPEGIIVEPAERIG